MCGGMGKPFTLWNLDNFLLYNSETACFSWCEIRFLICMQLSHLLFQILRTPKVSLRLHWNTPRVSAQLIHRHTVIDEWSVYNRKWGLWLIISICVSSSEVSHSQNVNSRLTDVWFQCRSIRHFDCFYPRNCQTSSLPSIIFVRR